MNKKVAKMRLQSLGDGVFKFPLEPNFKLSIKLNKIDTSTFDTFYMLFDDAHLLEIEVLDLKCKICGLITHYACLGHAGDGLVNAEIMISNIQYLHYEANPA